MNKLLSNKDIDLKLIGRGIIRISDYIGAKELLKFKCLTCKYEWATVSRNVCNKKSGCPKCAQKAKLSNEEVDAELLSKKIKRLENYINLKTKISFQCLIESCNHVWFAFPVNILHHNHGCPKCAKNGKLSNDIIDNGLQNRNIIRITDYTNSVNKVGFKCLKCNSTWAAYVGNVLRKKSGCPKCFGSVSKQEKEWLDSLNIPLKYRNNYLNVLGVRINVDAYNPETNTIYEFYGDFYHGNPMFFNKNDINPKNGISYGKLYQKTLDREKLIKKAGYTLITIWEHDFCKQYNIKTQYKKRLI